MFRWFVLVLIQCYIVRNINLGRSIKYDQYLNYGIRKVLEFKEGAHDDLKIDVLGEVFKKQFQLVKTNSKLDIVFLIDASSSVGEDNFQSELTFVKKVLSDITVDLNNTRVAVVTFSSPRHVIKNIDEISATKEENNKCKLLNQDLKEVSYKGGQTYTLGAFHVAKEIFSSSTRTNSQKVLFLITDGYSNGGDPTPLAKELKKQNITIFTIGIQNGNYKELFEISSPPGQFHSYLLDSFVDFESLARRALHADLKSGDYTPTVDHKLCDHLCKEGRCCDSKAICTCGTTTGHYTCLCRKGYYGSGLKNSCLPCESGTYSDGPNICLPCPDPNHITTFPSFGIDDCKCKTGFIQKEGACEEIRCPDFAVPENGYVVDSSNCSNKINSMCEIRCEINYSLIGDGKLICQNNGIWSHTNMVCEAQSCPKLDVPKDGIVECTNANTDKAVILEKEDTFISVDTVCTIKCSNGKILVGSEKRSCIPPGRWDGIKTSCKHIKCSKLTQIKFGEIQPSSCLAGKQDVGKICKVVCKEGFKVQGPSERRCMGGYGKWSSDSGDTVCLDVEPPKITCPKNTVGTTLPGKRFGHVFWKEPIVTDNSDLNVSIWMKPAITNVASFKFQIGTTLVAYYVQDAFRNKAQCSFKVIIKDEEPPTIEDCVDPPPFLTYDKKGANITWDEPHIYDNSQKVQVKKSRSFGLFEKGTTVVTYIAKDSSHNKAICKLNITVEESSCESIANPLHGQNDCTGEDYRMRCIVTCDEGYAIPMEQPDELSDGSENTFICDYTDPATYDSEDSPYRECTVTAIPESTLENGEITLDIDDCEDQSKINQMINEVTKSLNGYCVGGCAIDTSFTNCEVDNPIEYSSKISKRSSNYQQVPHRNKKQKAKVNVKFQVRGKYLNGSDGGNFTLKLSGGYNATIRHSAKKFVCPKGFAPRKNRCVQCPRGTFLNATRNKCQNCEFGYYNDKLGQMSCTPCSQHFSTMKMHAKKASDCKEQCPPGTHARKKRLKLNKSIPHGVTERPTLKPHCRSCAVGSYQSSWGQVKCVACPSGYTTFSAGTKEAGQCIPTAKQMCKTNGICGYGLCIETNEFQYSCNCFKNYIGTNCEKRVNYCESNPCYNSGTCINEDEGFRCKCRYRYKGKYCENEEEVCGRNCLNGGRCVEDDVEGPRCICLAGYTGRACESEVEICKPGICMNNSTCTEHHGTFKCLCPVGYVGRRCNSLPCDYRPCSGLRRCINLIEKSDSIHNYRCECHDGYTGENCEQIVDACRSSPCFNGGTCSNNLFSYTCNCPSLYYGTHCEQRKSTNYMLSFDTYETHNYVKLDGFKRNLSEITTCMWMYTPDNFNYGTLISYANRKFDNAFTVTDYTGLVLYINNNYVVTDVSLNDALWHHVCVIWKSENGSYSVHIDGSRVKTGNGLSTGATVEGMGTLVIGQEQDIMGGRFSQSETFVGKMAYIDVWARALSPEDLLKHFIDCNDSTFGDLYAWPKMQDNIKGEVMIENSTFCLRCPRPNDIPNGYVHVVNNIAHYSCRKGYQLSSGAYSDGRKCTKASKWENNFDPYCRRIYCGYPGFIRNGYPLGNRYHYQDKVTYRCYDGFDLIGNATITCGDDSMWYPGKPQCIGVQCPSFKKPKNSEMEVLSDQSSEVVNDSINFDVGTQVEFTCNPRANMSGQSVISCLENGTWDFLPPKCILEETEPHCPVDKLPLPPPNGMIVEESLVAARNGSSNFIEYKCQQGYMLKGDNTTTCITDGYWTVPNITCEDIICEKPQFPKNVELTEELRSTQKYRYGHVIAFKCEEGYSIFGNGNVRCLLSGKWSRMQGRCIKKSCRKPNVGTKTILQGKSYLYGDKVKITCASGSTYELACNKQGIWEGKKDKTC